jgi:hypothetical protein
MQDVIATGSGSFEDAEKRAVAMVKLAEDTHALRKRILDDAKSNSTARENGAALQTDRQREIELVEKTANRKGQEWGWSWDWGFPRPFDANDHRPQHDWRDTRGSHRVENVRRSAEEEELHPSNIIRSIMQRMQDDMERVEPSPNTRQQEREGDKQPKVWSYSFRWPPPADSQTESNMTKARSLGGQYYTFDGPRETSKHMTHPRNPYSPRALEQDKDLEGSGIEWRDAFEDLKRATDGKPLMPEESVGQSRHWPYRMWARRLHRTEEPPQHRHGGEAEYPKKVPLQADSASEEPSYEYSHDHEDQHDDPPTPKPDKGGFTDGMPATELEAYERLLGPVSAPELSTHEARTSILSTLTTTERTVAPDGTVTTKVVLKKRFADGREESSETLHTQRGQGVDAQAAIPDPIFANKDRAPPEHAVFSKGSENRKGWFWSN